MCIGLEVLEAMQGPHDEVLRIGRSRSLESLE